MAYIIERNHRFHVVAYDGIDPLTGRERRRWPPAGRSRADAIAATLGQLVTPATSVCGALTYVDWFNQRLHSELGDIPPAEFETLYYARTRTDHQAPTPTRT